MKLSQWAKSQGITYHTAWAWFKTGKLPVKAYQSATGTIIVDVAELDSPTGSGSAVYARVSSHDQKNDLDAQAGRVAVWAATNGVTLSLVLWLRLDLA